MKASRAAPMLGFAVLVSISGLILAQTGQPSYIQVRSVPHGVVQPIAYKSKALGSDRKVIVYTPPGYESAAGRRYPMLYLLHGAGSDETSWTERGLAHVILDNLIADGKLKPLVVAMPFGYAVPRAPGGNRGDAAENKMQRDGFTKDFIGDVIPLVESKYRVYADRDHRAIAGLSLGGAQSLAIGLSHLELFSRVAAFSPAMGASNNPTTGGVDFDMVLSDSARINEQLKLLWVGSGTEDTLFDSIRDFTQQLSKHKVEHLFRVTGGAHTYAVWQRYLNEVAPQLFPEN
jgi:enterochelin esterase-like enzyme